MSKMTKITLCGVVLTGLLSLPQPSRAGGLDSFFQALSQGNLSFRYYDDEKNREFNFSIGGYNPNTYYPMDHYGSPLPSRPSCTIRQYSYRNCVQECYEWTWITKFDRYGQQWACLQPIPVYSRRVRCY